MSDEESMFIIGSIVIVETGWGHSFEGEVIAFDYELKILLLKCSVSSGNVKRNDIHLVNLECAKNVKIKKEAKRKDQTNFPSIEIDKVRWYTKCGTRVCVKFLTSCFFLFIFGRTGRTKKEDGDR